MISRTNFLVLLASIALAMVILVEAIRFMPVSGRVVATLDATAFNLGDVTVSDLNGFWRMTPNVVVVNEAIPGVEKSTWTFATNAQGFRGQEISAKGERFRILAVGDSTTFGLGVNDSEAWPAILQQELGINTIEVINMGIPGSTAFQGLCQLLTFGLSLEPDLVIVTFGYNDQHGKSAFSDHEVVLSNKELTIKSSRHLVQAMDKTAKDDPRHQRRLTEGEFLDAMIEIDTACKRRNIKVIYLSWPYEYAVLVEDNPKDYRQQFPYLSSVTDSLVVDLKEVFRTSRDKLYIDSIHANPEGCRMVGEYLALFLRQKSLVPQMIASQ